MKTFEEQTDESINRKNLEKELEPNTNMRRLFIKKSGALQLNAWLAPNDRQFLPGKQKADRLKEYVVAERIFTRTDGLTITVRTFVAHPHYVKIANLGLLGAWSDLKPPKLSSDFALPTTVQGIPTTAYRTTDGGLSATIPVGAEALINITTPKWSDLSTALEFAERLDIARLKTKLAT